MVPRHVHVQCLLCGAPVPVALEPVGPEIIHRNGAVEVEVQPDLTDLEAHLLGHGYVLAEEEAMFGPEDLG